MEWTPPGCEKVSRPELAYPDCCPQVVCPGDAAGEPAGDAAGDTAVDTAGEDAADLTHGNQGKVESKP